MRLCLMVEGQENVTWDQWLALAAATERAGLDGLFRSDHYLSGDGRIGLGSLDAWTTLAGIAAHTSRIRLGTMVSPVTFRPPSVLANSATTVDHISGGRVEVGFGAGWYQIEHEAFGFPFPPLGTRMDMLAEQLEIATRQWTEAEFSFQGAHYQLDRCPSLPKPVQQPHPPVIIGGHGKPRSVALAARFAQEYNVFSVDLDECRTVRDRIDRACETIGRDPATLPLSVTETTVIGSDARELDRRLDDLAALMPDVSGGAELLQQRGHELIAGTVGEVSQQLRELAEVGVERVMFQHLCHADLEMVELIGDELVEELATV